MDLALDNSGDIAITTDDLTLVDGDDAIVQQILIRLRFFKGEWFLDPTVGVPYFDKILVKNPDLVAVRSILRKAVLSTPGIRSVDTFNLSLDTATRKATVSFVATKDDGTTLDFSKAFVIT